MTKVRRKDRGDRGALLKTAWSFSFGVVLVLIAIAWLSNGRPQPTHQAQAQGHEAPQKPPATPPQTRFIAVAGGATPDSNPISLEQNLALAHAVLPGPGVLLFGSGGAGSTVQVLDPMLPRDEVLDALGELFAPRAGRDSRYQATSLPAQSATATALRTELSIALARAGQPLLVYISGHGDQADAARDNVVQLWGGEGISAVDIAELHDHARARRGLRLVITSCFSGGFAELAFEGADAARGFAKKGRCGLFATTWDLESSGCDPNPNRAEQEGYSVHMLNALRGLDRDGVTPIDADLDDDGKVSLLEAHSRATIAARSIDVPTTTSQRFLREHITDFDDEPLPQPEADAVIAALGAELSITDLATTRARLKPIEAQMTALDEAIADAQDDHDAAYNTLAMELLERWPVIDDPWHPLFATMLREQRAEIMTALNNTEAGQRYASTAATLHRLQAQQDELQTRFARLARLQRAHEDRHLAAALKRQGGKVWTQYQQLLSCERGLP